MTLVAGLPSVTDCITGGVDARKLAEMVGARGGTLLHFSA